MTDDRHLADEVDIDTGTSVWSRSAAPSGDPWSRRAAPASPAGDSDDGPAAPVFGSLLDGPDDEPGVGADDAAAWAEDGSDRAAPDLDRPGGGRRRWPIGALANVPGVALGVLAVMGVTLAVSIPLSSGSAAPATASLPVPGHASPEAAVAGYLDAAMRNDQRLEGSYVGPATARSAYDAIPNDELVGGGVQLRPHGIQIASVSVRGSRATVVVTGSLCIHEPAGGTTPSFGDTLLCLSNFDPHTKSDGTFLFRYRCLEQSGRWYVDLSALLKEIAGLTGSASSSAPSSTPDQGDAAATSDLLSALGQADVVYHSLGGTFTGAAAQLASDSSGTPGQWVGADADLTSAPAGTTGLDVVDGQTAVVAVWSPSSSSCWYALEVETSTDPSVRTFGVPSAGVYYAATASGTCTATSAPRTGWLSDLSMVTPIGG